jgi:hypothetical protein
MPKLILYSELCNQRTCRFSAVCVAYILHEFRRIIQRKRFSKNIGNVQIGTDEIHGKNSFINEVAEPVRTKINVLRFGIRTGFLGKLKRRIVVAKDRNRFL